MTATRLKQSCFVHDATNQIKRLFSQTLTPLSLLYYFTVYISRRRYSWNVFVYFSRSQSSGQLITTVLEASHWNHHLTGNKCSLTWLKNTSKSAVPLTPSRGFSSESRFKLVKLYSTEKHVYSLIQKPLVSIHVCMLTSFNVNSVKGGRCNCDVTRWLGRSETSSWAFTVDVLMFWNELLKRKEWI